MLAPANLAATVLGFRSLRGWVYNLRRHGPAEETPCPPHSPSLPRKPGRATENCARRLRSAGSDGRPLGRGPHPPRVRQLLLRRRCAIPPGVGRSYLTRPVQPRACSSPRTLPSYGTSFGTGGSWLLPAAVPGLVAGLWSTHRVARTDRTRAAVTGWGGCPLATGVVLSVRSGTIHPGNAVPLPPRSPRSSRSPVAPCGAGAPPPLSAARTVVAAACLPTPGLGATA